jgi:hypothetical protein
MPCVATLYGADQCANGSAAPKIAPPLLAVSIENSTTDNGTGSASRRAFECAAWQMAIRNTAPISGIFCRTLLTISILVLGCSWLRGHCKEDWDKPNSQKFDFFHVSSFALSMMFPSKIECNAVLRHSTKVEARLISSHIADPIVLYLKGTTCLHLS